jgi:hypothetical protein
MPPKFMASSFEFENADDVPEHVEGYPVEQERDPSKIWLQGEDTFSSENYPLAIDIDDAPTARVLQSARIRLLEKEQPSSQSGGQRGIQDRVIVRYPAQS